MQKLLVFFMLATSLSSAPVADWPLNADFTDTSGNGYTLTENGTVPLGDSPIACGEFAMAGLFSDANYLAAPAGLLDAVESNTSWTLQFYANLSGTANSPVIWSYNNNGVGNFLQFNQGINPRIRFAGGGAALDVSHTAAIYNLHECVHFAFVVDGNAGTRSIYMGNVLQRTDANAVGSAFSSNVVGMQIGRYIMSNGFALNGYVSDVRLDLEALAPPFPTPADSRPGDKRGLKIKNYLRMKLGRKLFPIFNLSASSLQAAPNDQIKMSIEATILHGKQKIKAEKTKVHKKIINGEITVTPTLTRTPALSPTVTPTQIPGGQQAFAKVKK